MRHTNLLQIVKAQHLLSDVEVGGLHSYTAPTFSEHGLDIVLHFLSDVAVSGVDTYSLSLQVEMGRQTLSEVFVAIVLAYSMKPKVPK